MNGRLVQNEETGEHGIWDGQTLTPLHGRIVTNEKGDKALWDGKKLTPVKMDFDMSLPGAKEDVAKVESVGQEQPKQQPAASPPDPDRMSDLERQVLGLPPKPKSFGEGALQFGKETALPAAGSLIGARYGGIPGAVIGGMAGEAATQALGVKPSSVGDVIATGAMEAAIPGAGRLYQPAKRVAKQGLEWMAKKLPGASAALKQPSITRLRSLPGKFAPEIPHEQLYDELAESGDVLIPTTKSRQTLSKLAQEQPGKDPSLRDPAILRDVKALNQTYPETGKPFSEARAILKELDQKIGSAKAKGGERLHALTQRRNALLADMEAAAEHLPKLKQANQAYKQGKSADEFRSMVEGGMKTLEGTPSTPGKRSVVDFDAKSVLDRFRKITNPRNPEDYDALFAEGLGSKAIKEIEGALQKVNSYGPVRLGWSGGGSLVAQGAIAGAGGAVAGGLLGDAPGAMAGGLAAAAAPAVLSKALLNRSARAFLLKSLRSSGGKIANADQFLAVLGAIVQRTPTLAEE